MPAGTKNGIHIDFEGIINFKLNNLHEVFILCLKLRCYNSEYMRRKIGGIAILLFLIMSIVTTLTKSSSLFSASEDTHQIPLKSLDAETTHSEPIKGAATEVTTETATEEVPFDTKQVTSDEYSSGTRQILTEGRNGQRIVTYDVTISNGVEVSRVEIESKIIEEPVTEVVALGTRAQTTIRPVAAQNSCDPNYVPCVPVSSSDLDCSDIGETVQVIGSDPHRLDGDHDGVACESYN